MAKDENVVEPEVVESPAPEQEDKAPFSFSLDSPDHEKFGGLTYEEQQKLANG